MTQTTILTTLIDCNGVELAVPTVKLPGESWPDFGKRHEQDIADAEAACEEG